MTGADSPSQRVADLVAAAKAAERNADRSRARRDYESALRALGDEGSPALASALIRWIGRTLLEDGEMEAAGEAFEAARAVAEAHGDTAGVAHAVNCTAMVHHLRGQLDDAQEGYEWALARARSAGEDHLQAMIQQNLGAIANVRGDFEAALEHYEKSLEGYRGAGLQDYVGPLLNNIGRLHTDLQHWRQARETLADAHRRCSEAGAVSHEVLVRVNQARLHVALKDPAQAREYCDLAYELSRESGDERWLGEIMKQYGIVLRQGRKNRLAERYFNQARELAERHEDVLLLAETAAELAIIYDAEERNRETLQALNEAHRRFTELRARRELFDVGRRLADLEETFLKIVRRWGESIESKDRYTQGHCRRVADLACRIAAADGFDSDYMIWFQMGALLHDVGKVEIPTEILNKPGKLSEEEWVIMKRHPADGERLLEGIAFPWDVLPMVRHHHERWDGRGYPDGLGGNDIPRSAQILSLADVFDALTTDRSYRPGFSDEAALDIMRKEEGTAFNPELLALFLELMQEPADAGIKASSATG